MSLLDEVLAEAAKPIPITQKEFEGGIEGVLKDWELDEEFASRACILSGKANTLNQWLGGLLQPNKEDDGPLSIVEEDGIHYVLDAQGRCKAIYGPQSWAAIQKYCQP